MFPVPVTVVLWTEDRATSLLTELNFSDRVRRILLTADPKIFPGPGYLAGAVFCPFLLADEQPACFILYNADSALLKKFSPDWLQEFQIIIRNHLEMVRQIYIDPQTALYNSRALAGIVHQPFADRSGYALYLISIQFVRRSHKGVLRKINHLTRILSATENEGLFFLGQGIFALIVACRDKKQRLVYAHRLQKYLKHEGLQKVHLAFSSLAGEKSDSLVEDLLNVLSVAERRGPFGLCDADVLSRDISDHPFSLPGKDVLRQLRRLMRGVDHFTLALFFRNGENFRNGEKNDNNASTLFSLIVPLLTKRQQAVAFDHDHVFVFSRTSISSDHGTRFKEMINGLQSSCGNCITVGFCGYPCLNFTKTEIIRNCRKALLHGSFFDPGRVVAFDHLSLNVSGDYYFDEGDFRQAVYEYSRGLQMSAGDLNLLNSLGVALMEMNRVHAAIKSFKQVLERQPDNYMALVNLGYAYLQRGNDGTALDLFEKAYVVQYHSGITGTDIYRRLSLLYCKNGRYQDALAVLDRWNRELDTDGDVLFYRLSGEAYAGIGQQKKAMEYLQRALRLQPHDVESMSLLGFLYVEQDEGEETGFMLLDKALSIDETECNSWYYFARAQLFSGRNREALKAVEKCLRLCRTHAGAMILHARILSALAKHNRARRILDRLSRRKDLLTVEKREVQQLLTTIDDAA